MKTFILLVSLLIVNQTLTTKSYKIRYRLNYQPDSTNNHRVDSELFILYINNGESSIFGSEGRFKSDSIKNLIHKNILPKNVQIDSKYRYKTNFTFFVCKDYKKSDIIIHESISVDKFIYSASNLLEWKVLAQQDTIAGFTCTKATTHYSGRDYEAWFTTDIPISDGPYIFKGLPGLIIKISDTRSHYTFELQSFEHDKKERNYQPIYLESTPVQIDQNKIFSIRSEYRKDRLGYMSRRTGRDLSKAIFTTSNGISKPATEAVINRSWDNNPLELKP